MLRVVQFSLVVVSGGGASCGVVGVERSGLAVALSWIARSALASASRIESALAVVAVRGSSRRTCGRRPS